MKGYLGMILREHHLWDVLPVKPMFISAQDSWEWQRSGRIGQSPLAVLEEAIWTHLLSTNSTGLDRLIAAVTELRRAGSDFASLLETRRMSGGEAFSLRKSLDACRAREQELVTACHERAKIDEAFVRHRLTTNCVALLRRLQEQLEKVPLNQQLPPASHIEKEFQTQIMQLLTDVWKESSARFQNFASYVSQEVEKSLQQVRLRGC